MRSAAKVEDEPTDLGTTLGAVFRGVWTWAADDLARVEQARRAFDGVGDAW